MSPQNTLPSRWHRAIIVGAGLAIVTLAVVAAAATTRGKRAASAQHLAAVATARPALTVTTARVERTTLPSTIEASGAIAPWQEASVAARIAGLPLIAVNVNVGDAIRKGQVLARFDDADVRAALIQAEANVAQADASARQAAANRDRALVLEQSGALSKQDILQNVTQAATTQAQLAQAKAAADIARLKLGYAVVTAPDDGVVSSRSAVLGVVAQAGTELFRFIRQGRLEWRAELDAAQVSTVSPGLTVTVQLPDGKSATGHVRQLAPALSTDTRLVLAYVDLDSAASARAGMYASGAIQTALRDATVVPAESVVIRDGRPYVLRLDGGRAQQVAVSIGRRHGKVAEILSGVSAGDTVVVRGAGFVNDKDVVRVENEAQGVAQLPAAPQG